MPQTALTWRRLCLRAGIAAFFASVLFFAPGCGDKEESIGPRPSAVRWANSFEDGIRLAGETGKPVMLVFYADWCGWCVKLSRDVFTDSKVGAASEGLVNIRVNTDKREDLAERFKVRYLPTILFLTSKGDVLGDFQGERTPSGFVEAMEKIAVQKSSGPEPA
jgi:thiol:disulfide interchange protein